MIFISKSLIENQTEQTKHTHDHFSGIQIILSLERNDCSEELMFDDWVFAQNLNFVHFDHSNCYFVPVRCPADVVQNR